MLEGGPVGGAFEVGGFEDLPQAGLPHILEHDCGAWGLVGHREDAVPAQMLRSAQAAILIQHC
jgi:hypothetical protein